MEGQLTIQQVAEATGLSVHTLRYYERCHLISPIARDSNGHRRYSERDLGWIEFLTCLRTTGMPIRQMQQYVELMRQSPEAIRDRRLLLEAHQQQVREQMQQLQKSLDAIAWKIQHYEEIEAKLEARGTQKC